MELKIGELYVHKHKERLGVIVDIKKDRDVIIDSNYDVTVVYTLERFKANYRFASDNLLKKYLSLLIKDNLRARLTKEFYAELSKI